jgi:gas vesicle protein
MSFLLGLVVGALVGFFVAALCVAARRGDELMGVDHEH